MRGPPSAPPQLEPSQNARHVLGRVGAVDLTDDDVRWLIGALTRVLEVRIAVAKEAREAASR